MNIQDFISTYPSFEAFEDELVKRILEVADENPDFVYNPFDNITGCYYDGPARNGKNIGPECNGCIIGTALQKMGVARIVLAEMFMGISSHIEGISTKIIQVQRLQDAGVSWGKAVEPLKKRLTEAIPVVE